MRKKWAVVSVVGLVIIALVGIVWYQGTEIGRLNGGLNAAKSEIEQRKQVWWFLRTQISRPCPVVIPVGPDGQSSRSQSIHAMERILSQAMERQPSITENRSRGHP